MDTESTSYLLSKHNRIKLFCKLYWRTIFKIITPFIFLPVAFLGIKNEYRCFYVFLLTNSWWLAGVLPHSITALLPIALTTILSTLYPSYVLQINLSNAIVNCLGVMMLIVAIERSLIHRRLALYLLLKLGCSHYRLSFLLFYISMFLSMWMSNSTACGIMMPFVKAILIELEKLGVLEVNQSVGKSQTKIEGLPKPTAFTIFYFLGIAYSSSVGGMATIAGSEANQIFKHYCETAFTSGPKIEFPHYMLFTLPGVLLIETLLYLWLNFYFLGMFRSHTEIALQMTEEEDQYTSTILRTQQLQLGKVSFHEIVVISVVIFTAILPMSVNIYSHFSNNPEYNHMNVYATSMISVIILFITPIDLEFINFFRKKYGALGAEETPLPKSESKGCLDWNSINSDLHWSVLFIIGGSSALFESLKDTGMTSEFEKFLLLFSGWPAPALVLVSIIFCKLMTEFAPNACVVNCLLSHIAAVSLQSKVHPYYLMLASTLASSLPFHFVNGAPNNAMVAAYMNIPPWDMMCAGIGPTIISIVVIWFTVTVWSKAIWTDIHKYPDWAKNYTLYLT